MKRWQTIPALLALIALLLPCEHNMAGHDHADCAPEAACIAAHPVCHTCTESFCSEKISILPANSILPVDLPERTVCILRTLSTDNRPVLSVRLPAVALLPLQTVQLLI